MSNANGALVKRIRRDCQSIMTDTSKSQHSLHLGQADHEVLRSVCEAVARAAEIMADVRKIAENLSPSKKAVELNHG